ncbi:hypothetical protein JCM14036_10420 [Desulfotomaculum defluvii]
MLKKLAIGALTTALVMSPVQPELKLIKPSAQAIQAQNKATFVVGAAYYSVNGETQQMDAKTYIDPASGRTMVPVRYLAKACGVNDTKIAYINGAIGLTFDDTSITLAADNKTIVVNNQSKEMDVAPVVKNGRTYLPARWVAEGFGYTVGFDSKNQAVLVYPPGTEAPTVPQKPVIDLTDKGTENAKALGFTFVESLVKKNISDLDSQSFKINNDTITNMEVTEKGIFVSQINDDGVAPGGVGVRLIQHDNSTKDDTYWGINSFAPPSTEVRKMWYPLYLSNNPVAEHLDDIRKIKYIWIEDNVQVIQFDNPLYRGY